MSRSKSSFASLWRWEDADKKENKSRLAKLNKCFEAIAESQV